MLETVGFTDIFPVMADSAVRGLVLLALAGLITLAMWRRSAAARHLVWTLALAALLAVPVLRAAVPDLPLAILPAPVVERAADRIPDGTTDPGVGVGVERESTPVAEARGSGGVAAGATVTGGGSAGSEGAGAAARTPSSSGDVATGGAARVAADPASGRPKAAVGSSVVGRGLAGWAALAWLAGVLALLAPVVAGWIGVRRLERRSRRLEDPRVRHLATRLALRLGVRRRYRLLLAPPRTMPMTFGLLRPVIVLPEESREWRSSRLEAVLMHELAHVGRRDTLTQLVAELARAAYWYNPLVWLATRRLRVEREHACDDVAIRSGARPSEYADELLGLARSYRASRATTLAAVAMARPSQLSTRLLAVLDDDRSHGQVGRRAAVRAAVAAVLLTLPVAALTPAAQAAQGSDPASGPEPAAVPQAPGAPAAPAVRAPTVRPTPILPPLPLPPRPLAGGSIEAIQPLTPLPAPETAQDPTCASERGDWNTMQHQSNNGRSTVTMRRRGCELEVRLEGDVSFDGAELGVSRLGRDGRLRMEEKSRGTERSLEVRPGDGGRPAFAYRVDGRDAPFDGAARAWYRAVMLHLFRSAGFAAEERVAALVQEGGVEAVLREMGRLESDFVFARYTRELFEQVELDEAAARALLRASAERVDSDHYMSEILRAVATHQPVAGGMLDDYIVAALSLESDHYRTEVLRGVVRDGKLSDSQVTAVLRAAGEMESDHYRSEILTQVADRYALAPAFRPAYLDATAGMESDHYRAEVLGRLLGRSDLTADEKAAVLDATAMIESDHYRTELLRRVGAGGLGGSGLQRAYFRTAAGLESDHYYRQAMEILLREPLEPALTVEVLDRAAREMESDHYLSEMLLGILERQTVSGSVRDAFIAAMDSIESEHYRGRVADALLQAERR